jgi:hypothetical protein
MVEGPKPPKAPPSPDAGASAATSPSQVDGENIQPPPPCFNSSPLRGSRRRCGATAGPSQTVEGAGSDRGPPPSVAAQLPPPRAGEDFHSPPVAPAQAGAYRACRSRQTHDIDTCLRWCAEVSRGAGCFGGDEEENNNNDGRNRPKLRKNMCIFREAIALSHHNDNN